MLAADLDKGYQIQMLVLFLLLLLLLSFLMPMLLWPACSCLFRATGIDRKLWTPSNFDSRSSQAPQVQRCRVDYVRLDCGCWFSSQQIGYVAVGDKCRCGGAVAVAVAVAIAVDVDVVFTVVRGIALAVQHWFFC